MIDNKKYYEQYDWNVINKEGLSEKIKKILELIPEDVETIADVGCGNGVITNALAEKFKVLGIDRSANALSYVKTDTLQASSDNIPLPDNSFDLVLSSEMIEHLDNETLQKTISELKRLSKKYILITVPNNENLKKFLIKCPSCGKQYNHSYHLHSFTAERLKNLFPEYNVMKLFYFGASVRKYNETLSRVKIRLCPPSSWFPFFAKTSAEKTMCPYCEHTFVHKYKFHLLAFFIDVLNLIVSRKVPYWIFILFSKT